MESTSSAVLGLFDNLYCVTSPAIIPTLKQLFRTPWLIFSPTTLSRLFMARVWSGYGDSIDQNSHRAKEHLITPNANGVVVDIGAGFGHAIKYLDTSRVTRYVAIEPNPYMHTRLRTTANAAGFSEANNTLLILPLGAEDTFGIVAALDGVQADCLISVLSLCSVPDPQNTLSKLVRDILRPGGVMVYLEHVLNDRADMAWWGKLLAPVWQLPMDGCRIDRPTHKWIADLKDEDGESAWREGEMWAQDGELREEITLFLHRLGRYVKK